MNVAEQIFAFEQGELEYDDVVDLFQALVDTGLAWKLQGSYGRMARGLILAGEVIIRTPGITAERRLPKGAKR